MNQAIPASQLVLNGEGTVYHLALHPEELADDVILVGDPGRVDMIASYFEKIEVKRQNRELWSRTGYYNGKRITVLSTGMGTDNLDIVMNELDTLANIDLKTRMPKEEHRTLNLIRLGTSGGQLCGHPLCRGLGWSVVLLREEQGGERDCHARRFH